MFEAEVRVVLRSPFNRVGFLFSQFLNGLTGVIFGQFFLATVVLALGGNNWVYKSAV